MTGDDRLTEQIKTDYREADLELRTRVMLDYAVMITSDVHRVTRETIDGLRRGGLSDEEIHDVAQIASLFNYYNRLADGLGIEPEDFMKGGRRE